MSLFRIKNQGSPSVFKPSFHLMAFLNIKKACLAMVCMQFLYAGMALLSKEALNKGMSYLVFVVYRQATATLALAPFAYVVESYDGIHLFLVGPILIVINRMLVARFIREDSCKLNNLTYLKKASSLSLVLFCKIFLLALFGPTLSLDLFYMALRYTSATFASASINIIPAVTFLIAILVRMETVDWRRIYGQCKITGVVLCVGGAVVLSVYKGPSLQLLHWHFIVASQPEGSFVNFNREEKKTLVEGPLLMFAAYISYSTWVIMQAKMLKAYPAKLSLTTLQCLLSTIQSGIIAVSIDRNLSSWRLGWNVQLISVVYCGVFISAVCYWLQLWGIEKKGPVYVAMFSPLSVLMTAIISAVIWAELLYLGSVLGGVLIIGGVYCVLWGKSKEERD